jgi:hypothetical protein
LISCRKYKPGFDTLDPDLASREAVMGNEVIIVSENISIPHPVTLSEPEAGGCADTSYETPEPS